MLTKRQRWLVHIAHTYSTFTTEQITPYINIVDLHTSRAIQTLLSVTGVRHGRLCVLTYKFALAGAISIIADDD